MNRTGFVTGLAAEARIASRLGPARAGGGTPEGAAAAAERLAGQGVVALVSFGLCGGLDPRLRAGDLLVPRAVLFAEERWETEAGLSGWLKKGSPTEAGVNSSIYAATAIIARASDKAVLHAATNAAAVDLESAAVARVAMRHGLPFAVLRAVCDPVDFDLPPAALLPLSPSGQLRPAALAVSLLRHPSQMAALLALGRHAAAARAALVRRVGDLVAAGGGRVA
jgi:adenosylhomocysteine nucleosidase